MVDEERKYVFIDESGDVGFKLARGSSPIFCITAVIFQDTEAIASTQETIQQFKAALGRKKTQEFHFNKEQSKVRKGFCEAVRDCPFAIRAIVMDKTKIYEGTMLRQSPNYFYNFTAKMLLSHSFGSITNARVVIDGTMDRGLKTYLHKELNRETRIIRKTTFSDSKKDSIIQLADMAAGSISRSYKPEKKDCQELRRILRPRIEDIWDFGIEK